MTVKANFSTGKVGSGTKLWFGTLKKKRERENFSNLDQVHFESLRFITVLKAPKNILYILKNFEMFRTHLHNFKRQISIVLLSYPIQNTPLPSIYSQKPIFSKVWDRAGQDPSQEEERGPSSSHPRSSRWSPSPMRSGRSVFRTFSHFFWFTKKWEVGRRGQQTNLILYLASLSITLPFSKSNICIAQEPPFLSLLGET